MHSGNFWTTSANLIIIGEFHMGAVDRGMFHPGLVSTPNQSARAASFVNYVRSVVDNPVFVGCHYFQIQRRATHRSTSGRRELWHRLHDRGRWPLPRNDRRRKNRKCRNLPMKKAKQRPLEHFRKAACDHLAAIGTHCAGLRDDYRSHRRWPAGPADQPMLCRAAQANQPRAISCGAMAYSAKGLPQ